MTDITEVPEDIRETVPDDIKKIATICAYEITSPDLPSRKDIALISQALLTERNTTLERAVDLVKAVRKTFPPRNSFPERAALDEALTAIRREIK